MRLPIAALATLLLAGCEVYAVPDPIECPGTRQGTFDFGGTQVTSPSDCFFAQPGNPAYQVNNPITFQAVVSFGPGAADAAVCVQAAHAVPRIGTHSALDLDVAYTNVTGSVGGCTCPSAEAVTAGSCLCPTSSPLQNCLCPAVVTERIVGSLIPVPGGYSGFDGQMRVSVSPPPFLNRPDVCNCQVACSYNYALTAQVVGAR